MSTDAVLTLLRFAVAMLLTVGVYAPFQGDPRASLVCLIGLAVTCLADKDTVDTLVADDPQARRFRVEAFITTMNLIAMLVFGLAASVIAHVVQWLL